ncbi:MAG: PLP-dependent aminotransferase family protein [Thiothrix sp.]|nr:MAG: PLP-dependent aminotransferase family protein [Thiothrix sp.]
MTLLYQEIANRLHQYIDAGLYKTGERLPGVRLLSQQFGVSVSTIVQAQRQLENEGTLEARPRSGYYICERPWIKPDLPSASTPPQRPMPVTGQELSLHLARVVNQEDFIQLGAAVPHASFLPMRALQRSLNKVVRNYDNRAANYAFPPGLPVLQQQIARRMLTSGERVRPEDILITNGGHEALTLALRTVAQVGDIIAIESPTFYGLLQVIDSLGMKALEIPTDPQTGISLPALELALEQWPIKACVLIPNFHNPLGCLLSDADKQALVKLAHKHRVPLIEDDIYADLAYNAERPRSLHSFDPQQVIYCSSFSKTIAQGLRLGWMLLPPPDLERATYFKYVTNLAAPTLSQLSIADYLEHGGHERYLRQVQLQYQQQVSLFARTLNKYLPEGTRLSQPKGGFVLWVELPKGLDTLALAHRMLEHKVSIAPGCLFTASTKYTNCIRINCAQPWSPAVEKALISLGHECLRLRP